MAWWKKQFNYPIYYLPFNYDNQNIHPDTYPISQDIHPDTDDADNVKSINMHVQWGSDMRIGVWVDVLWYGIAICVDVLWYQDKKYNIYTYNFPFNLPCPTSNDNKYMQAWF
jgi:aryl-phospho-beta-D-glucosidase BglC (GH1 family)